MPMNPSEIIRAKRDARKLDSDTIGEFIESYLAGEVADYQMSAFLMAAFLNGMDGDEAAALTKAYIDSGKTIDWSDLPGIPVDKHSTGGVGDKVSLILTPLVAACGAYVPMLSGRGLGHTGGTLDKLEAIPGFTTDLSIERFKAQVQRIGCAMGRQTGELAPADGRIYALRDVTATVESIPLISASIMSKKLAEGAKGLVLDVKVGSGAFMNTVERAEELASMLIKIGNAHGQEVRALLTNMWEPLGIAVGNALEAEESILLMRREIELPNLEEIILSLAAEMLVLSGIVESREVGHKIAREKLDDGSALVKFGEMIEAQEGNPHICDDLSIFPVANVIIGIQSPETGYIKSIDTRAVGMASVELGAGRKKSADIIDPSVGMKIFANVGDKFQKTELLGEVHASTEDSAKAAVKAVLAAITFSETAPKRPNLVIKTLPE